MGCHGNSMIGPPRCLEFVCKHQAHKATNNKDPLRQDFCFTFQAKVLEATKKSQTLPFMAFTGSSPGGSARLTYSDLSRTRTAEGNVPSGHCKTSVKVPSPGYSANTFACCWSATCRLFHLQLRTGPLELIWPRLGFVPQEAPRTQLGWYIECDAEVIYPQDRSPLPWWQTCCTIETSCLPEDSQRHCLEPRASSPPTSALLPHVGSPHTALHWVSKTWVWCQCCQQLDVQIHFRNEESSDSLNLPRKSPHLGRWPDDKVRKFQTHGHAALESQGHHASNKRCYCRQILKQKSHLCSSVNRHRLRKALLALKRHSVGAPKNGDQCFSMTPETTWNLPGLRLSLWRSSPLPELLCRRAEAKLAILHRKCDRWKCTCCMSQKGFSVVGNLEPGKYALQHYLFPRHAQIFPFQNSPQLTNTDLPKVWMLAASLKIRKATFTFSLQAALKEWRPCASWRTCRAALPLPSKEAQMHAPIVPANSRCYRGRHLCLTLAGCMLLPVVGVQEQLLQIPQASLHKCSPATQTLPLWTQQFPLAAFVAPSLLQWPTQKILEQHAGSR